MSALDHPRLGGKIGQRLISKVIADIARLRAQGVALGHVAVNLSSENVNDNTFPDWLMKQLAKANLPPEMIKLEITERVLLDELAENAANALAQLRGNGMRVSLDDFGTGYASLTHLQRFPVDEIKIDQSFICGLAIDSSNAAIVKAMINLGHNLGMDVVAEGVEITTQALLLRNWGCNIAQGFLYARPMPVDDIAAFAAGLASESPQPQTIGALRLIRLPLLRGGRPVHDMKAVGGNAMPVRCWPSGQRTRISASSAAPSPKCHQPALPAGMAAAPR